MEKEVDERVYELENKYFKYQISLNQIILFSSRWPFVELCAVNETIRFRGNLHKVEEQMKKMSDDFIRVNKRCLINKKYIKRCTKTEVIMMNHESIPVTKGYTEKLWQET